MFHHRKSSKDSITSPLSGTTLHSSTSSKTHETYKIDAITTVSELNQIFETHHHKHVVVFCLPSDNKEPPTHNEDKFDEESWYSLYAKLNNVHFVKAEVEKNEDLEGKLQPRTKPCWITFHKGSETGASSGGLRRFIQAHSEKKDSA